MVIIAIDPARNELGMVCYDTKSRNLKTYAISNPKNEDSLKKIRHIHGSINENIANFIIQYSKDMDKVTVLCEKGFGIGGVSESLERVRGVIELIAAYFEADFVQIHPSTWKSYWNLKEKPSQKFIENLFGVSEKNDNIRDAILFLFMFLQKNFSEVFDASRVNWV